MKTSFLVVLSVLLFIHGVKLVQGATVVINDLTINQSITLTNFYSNNTVIDFGRQINAGDSISVSWTESNQQLISNPITSNSVATNIDTFSGPATPSILPGFGYEWQGTSSLNPQAISGNTSGVSPSFPYSYNTIFTLTAPISNGNPLVFTTAFDYIFQVVNVQSGRFPNPPNGYGNPGYGTIFTTTFNKTYTDWSQTVTIVPEPSTYALFGIGAIGLLMVMRRKKTA